MRKSKKPKISLPIYISVYLVLFACIFVAWNQLHKFEQEQQQSIKNIRLYVANNSRNTEPLAINLYGNGNLIYQDTTSKTFTEAQLHVAPGRYQFELRIVNRGLKKSYQQQILAGQLYLFAITYEYEPPYAQARKYLLKEAYEYEIAQHKSRDTTYWARYFDEHQYRFPEKPRAMKMEIESFKNNRTE